MKEATEWWAERGSNSPRLDHRIYSPARCLLRFICPFWVEHRGSNPNLQCHKLPCCRYTMDHMLVAGPRVELGSAGLWGPLGNRSSLQYWCLTRASNPHKTDSESVMSAYCINQAFLQTTQSRSAFRLLVFMYSTVLVFSLLPFAYHLLLALPQRLER